MGKRAVVTGAAGGMGEAVVQRLCASDVDVLAIDLDARRLEGARTMGARVLAIDLTDPVARESLAEHAGDIDYLVNAAGSIRLQPITEVTPSTWRSMFAVNCEAPFFLIQGLAPRMRDSGAIVNVSSMVARLPRPDFAAYAASKEALLSVTRAWAATLAPRGIRVNAVCPGIIDTPMQNDLYVHARDARGLSREALDELRLKGVPLGRLGTAEDCADAIAFLLSDKASYLTGLAMAIDGGMTMC